MTWAKGNTPESLLPKHHGHEAAGVPLVEAIAARLRVPKDYRELALTVTRHHLQIHRVHEMRAPNLLKLLDWLDAQRRPERLQEILNACEADATGRTGLQQQVYKPGAYVMGGGERDSRSFGK